MTTDRILELLNDPQELKALYRRAPDMSWIDEGGDVADFHPEHQGSAMFNRHAAEQLFGGSPLTFEDARDAGAATHTPLYA